MTSNKKKGDSKENKAKKLLIKEGHTILFKSCTVKRGPMYLGLDFGDLYDLVTLKQERFPILENEMMHPIWYFTSVKHYQKSGGAGIAAHKRAIIEFKEKNGLPGMVFELWRWKKPGMYGRGKNKAYSKGEFLREVIA